MCFFVVVESASHALKRCQNDGLSLLLLRIAFPTLSGASRAIGRYHPSSQCVSLLLWRPLPTHSSAARAMGGDHFCCRGGCFPPSQALPERLVVTTRLPNVFLFCCGERFPRIQALPERWVAITFAVADSVSRPHSGASRAMGRYHPSSQCFFLLFWRALPTPSSASRAMGDHFCCCG